MRVIKLYKITKKGLVFIDYGIESQMEIYATQGYVVTIDYR